MIVEYNSTKFTVDTVRFYDESQNGLFFLPINLAETHYNSDHVLVEMNSLLTTEYSDKIMDKDSALGSNDLIIDASTYKVKLKVPKNYMGTAIHYVKFFFNDSLVITVSFEGEEVKYNKILSIIANLGSDAEPLNDHLTSHLSPISTSHKDLVAYCHYDVDSRHMISQQLFDCITSIVPGEVHDQYLVLEDMSKFFIGTNTAGSDLLMTVDGGFILSSQEMGLRLLEK